MSMKWIFEISQKYRWINTNRNDLKRKVFRTEVQKQQLVEFAECE